MDCRSLLVCSFFPSERIWRPFAPLVHASSETRFGVVLCASRDPAWGIKRRENDHRREWGLRSLTRGDIYRGFCTRGCFHSRDQVLTRASLRRAIPGLRSVSPPLATSCRLTCIATQWIQRQKSTSSNKGNTPGVERIFFPPAVPPLLADPFELQASEENDSKGMQTVSGGKRSPARLRRRRQPL